MNRRRPFSVQIRRWLAPTLPEGASLQRNQTARLLNIFLLAIVAVTFPTILLLVIAGPYLRVETLIPSLGIVATAVFLRVLLRRGYVQQTAILFSIGLWLLLALVALLSGGGVRNAAYVGLMMVILIAGTTIGTYASILACVASILVGAFLIWNGENGWLTIEGLGLTATNDWAYLSALAPLFLLMPVLVWITRRAFAQTIEYVRETEAQRLRTAELEQVVSARTAEMEASLQRERLLAADLRNALEEESRLRQLQAQIIDMILHEFRTPLTLAQTALDLMYTYRESLTPEQAEASYGRGTEGIYSLARMLDETAVVAKTDSVDIPIHPRTILLRDLSALLEANARRALRDRAATLHWQVSGDPLCPLTQDPAVLDDVLFALIDNAIKYSPDTPDVWVTCSCNAGGSSLILQVRDEGIGIPTIEAASIGSLFARCSNARFMPGLGLGIYVARRRATALGGTLTLSSPGENCGTTAVVIVPIHLPHADSGVDDSLRVS